MKYISHLNSILHLFQKDSRLNPTHISLYMALFREWNLNRFSQQFGVPRNILMERAKIGSKSTYHRCLRDLDEWKYIFYKPSHNPHTGSVVQMTNFCADTAPNNGPGSPEIDGQVEHYSPTSVPVTIYKHENMITQGRQFNEQEFLKYFASLKQTPERALKFFSYYQSRNWKVSGGSEVRDWKALAESWISRSAYHAPLRSTLASYGFKDYLKNTKDKDYGEPL